MYGWAGQNLRVDLTAGTITKEPLDPTFARMFLGGRGFNSKILYDEFDPAITDPYDPGNLICIGSGPLSGTLAPSSGRVTISVARSPITGVFGDGNAGGHFGPEIKYAGYDTIIIKGRSEKPVYLYIYDDVVELRDASHLWGKDVWQTDHILRAGRREQGGHSGDDVQPGASAGWWRQRRGNGFQEPQGDCGARHRWGQGCPSRGVHGGL